MYFALSKTLGVLLQPSNALLIGLTLGLVLYTVGRRRAGLLLSWGCFLAIWCAAVLPVGEEAIRRLEDRFPPPQALPAQIGGIIALGGGLDPALSRARGQISVGGDVERLLFLRKLAEAYSGVPLVYTGGSNRLFDNAAKEADYFPEFARLIGWDPARLVLESKSRNTYENAVFSKALVTVAPDKPWILITSARHMPRAIGIFRKQGWPVIAYPVDYITAPGEGGYPPLFLNLSHGLGMVDSAAHELLGLAAARLAGHSDSFFPGP